MTQQFFFRETRVVGVFKSFFKKIFNVKTILIFIMIANGDDKFK